MPFAFSLYASLVILYILFVVFIEKISFSIKNMFFLFFLIFYGPAFFSYNGKIGYSAININSAYILSIFIVFFWLGGLLLRSFGALHINYRHWYREKLEPIYINKVSLYALVLVTAFFMVLGLFVYGGINGFRQVLSSSLTESFVSELRDEGADRGWSWKLINYLSASLTRFICFILIGLYVLNRDRWTLVVATVYFLLVSLCLLANLSKSAFLVFFTQILVLIFLLKNYKLDLGRGVLILMVILPMTIFVYLNYTGAQDAKMALELIQFRVFDEPNRVLNMYSEYWPQVKAHTYGSNVRLIHNFFKDTPYQSAAEFLAEGKKGRTYNAIFIADAWVDFSYWGVALFSVFMGAYLSFLDYLCFSRKNVLNIALLACTLIGTFTLVNAGMITALIAFGLLTMPILHYCLRIRF